jgi:PIN domain nuclease of toxin-antitoxin system
VTDAVLDASALLAFLRNEPGADKVAAVLTDCCISAVNLSETLTLLLRYGKSLEAAAHQVERLRIPVVAFDQEQARIAAALAPETRHAGLSLADRCCLALGKSMGLPVLTADREWSRVAVGVEVEIIR